MPSSSASINEGVNEIGLDETFVSDLKGKLKDTVCTHGLKMLHLNVRSLNGKINELRSVFSTLKSGLHLITLSKTWLSSDILASEIEIVDYNLYRRDRKTKGGGVAVYVRQDLCVVLRVYLESSDVEALWLQINLPKSHAFPVGTFYRPPHSSKNHDPNFVLKLENIVDFALAQFIEVISLGDFNCDFLARRSLCNVTTQLKVLVQGL